MTSVAVIDHGAGNLVSIAQGLRRAGAEVRIAATPEEIDGADGLVLPGVGTTAAAMERLQQAGLVEALRHWERPLLGICIGLQLFFDFSEEDGSMALGLIPGTVRRLGNAPLLPHMGWNDVELRDDPIFEGIRNGSTFYFVHSFAPVPENGAVVIGESAYDDPFVAAVRSGRRVGVQFHPERSAEAGLKILANFVEISKENANAA